MLLAGCATPEAQRPAPVPMSIKEKLEAARPIAIEHRAQAVIQPKQYWLVWDGPGDYPVQFQATQNLRDWYVYGYAPSGTNTFPLAATNLCEFFRCRYVLPDGTFSGWNQ